MKTRFFEISLIAIVLILLYVALPALSVVLSSPSAYFNAIPENVSLNWTNNYAANVTLTATGSMILEVLNITSFEANYTQPNTLFYCLSPNHTLTVQNTSGVYSSVAGPMTTTNFTLIYDKISQSCSPGRYWIKNLMVANYTNYTENLNVSVVLNRPISINSTGMNTFAGTMPANATYYHSYYFNVTSVPNATSVVVSLASSDDTDLFLFDSSGNLKAKSISKSTPSEWLVYNYLPTTTAMWEIRTYGNSTTAGITYSGSVIFSTLNLTNTSSPTQQISSITWDNMNSTNISTASLTLKNSGNSSISNILESKEIYRVQRFI